MQNFNVAVVQHSYMFRLLQSNHHQAEYQGGNYITCRLWTRARLLKFITYIGVYIACLLLVETYIIVY